MTITQLEYILAVDTHKNFVQAAERCFVTQPTLSMQIQKLEEELGVLIFDRSRQPVVTTDIGIEIIDQARKIISEHAKIKEIIKENKGIISGNLNIGIIPTLAPYLLPLFLTKFLNAYPELTIHIAELTTEQIITQLKKGQLDCGILAAPIEDHSIQETPLFYEPFVAFVSKSSALYKKTTLSNNDIDINDIWLLDEGHCLRNQTLSLCRNKNAAVSSQLNYKSGSIETLKRMVEQDKGITILPELAIHDFNAKQRGMVRYFKSPEPVREIAVVTHRNFVKKRLIEILSEAIVGAVPEKMKKKEKQKIIPVTK